MGMLDPGLVAFVHSGVAATVGTRGADLRPAITRAWGPRVSADGRSLELCVIAPPGSQTRANLEENGAIAVGFSPPTIARALQVKGVVVSVREPEREDLERAERHFGAFTAEVEQFGISGRVARRVFGPPSEFLAVMLSIDEVFDQTPGPRAGRRV
jgi:hypothetical protein